RSDPGVTIIEVFAFLTESLLYRANQIPERNRRKFLQLLRIPLNSATAARGLVTISNDAATFAPQPLVLPEGLEVRAGQVPFRTTRALDVLPVEGRIYVKRSLPEPAPQVLDYYKQLYASYRGDGPEVVPALYEAAPFPTRDGTAVSLADTTDNSLWLALLVREFDAKAQPEVRAVADKMRAQIAQRTLTLGV